MIETNVQPLKTQGSQERGINGGQRRRDVNAAAPRHNQKPSTAELKLKRRLQYWEHKMKPNEDIGKGLIYHRPGSENRWNR